MMTKLINCYYCGRRVEEDVLNYDNHPCCDDCYDYESDRPAYDEDEDYLIDGVGFADPGGRSALRAATKNNPRCFPCPVCHAPNILTMLDVDCGYCCNRCADVTEGLLPDY